MLLGCACCLCDDDDSKGLPFTALSGSSRDGTRVYNSSEVIFQNKFFHEREVF